MKIIHIIGAGLTGAVIASQFKNCIVYERGKIGGLCRDNEKYQEYVHILHTNNKKVWDFVNEYTEVKPFEHFVKSYVNGFYKPWIPTIMTQQVIEEQMMNYNLKMWRSEAPKEALARCQPKSGSLFDTKYQGVPNFRMLFNNLLKNTKIVRKNIKHNNINDEIIVLTGSIDEFYDYCFGKLPYRGMKSCHCQSETGLEVPVINFPNDFPFIRMIDYQRLGYQNYIGFEFPSDDKHYPVNTKESKELFLKYKNLAKNKIILAGRLGTYTYLDMDQCIEQGFNIIKTLKKLL